jgi:hypothetical protein
METTEYNNQDLKITTVYITYCTVVPGSVLIDYLCLSTCAGNQQRVGVNTTGNREPEPRIYIRQWHLCMYASRVTEMNRANR